MNRYIVFVGSLAASSRVGGTVTSPLHIVWPASVLVSWLLSYRLGTPERLRRVGEFSQNLVSAACWAEAEAGLATVRAGIQLPSGSAITVLVNSPGHGLVCSLGEELVGFTLAFPQSNFCGPLPGPPLSPSFTFGLLCWLAG